MKTKKKLLLITLSMLSFIFTVSSAQDDDDESPFSFGADFVNRYIFRGLDFGSSPAIQPSLEFTLGRFSIGAWGSYAFISTPSGIEADLYLSYSFDFGLSLSITDYYFPGEQLKLRNDSTISPVRTGNYFNYSNNHFFETSAMQEIGDLYLQANYGAYNMKSAIYIEVGYGFKYVNLFAGAGNELYSVTGKFNIVNLGITASKEISLNKQYAIQLSSSVILNPDTEQIHLVFALGL